MLTSIANFLELIVNFFYNYVPIIAPCSFPLVWAILWILNPNTNKPIIGVKTPKFRMADWTHWFLYTLIGWVMFWIVFMVVGVGAGYWIRTAYRAGDLWIVGVVIAGIVILDIIAGKPIKAFFAMIWDRFFAG